MSRITEYNNSAALTHKLEKQLIKDIEVICEMRWDDIGFHTIPNYYNIRMYGGDNPCFVIEEVEDWWDLPKASYPALKELGFVHCTVEYIERQDELHRF